MIDLEKEREAFIKVYTEIYGEHDQLWQGWKARAELAQAEITELKKEEIKYKEKHGQLIGKIHVLEKKLVRYENPYYVWVPRKPTEKIINNLGWSTAETILKDDEDFIEIYKAVIEAVEEDNAQQNS